MEQSIEVPADWESIATLMAFTDSAETCMPVSEPQSFLMRLVIEEIATNIVKYGYDDQAHGVIKLTCIHEDGVLRVVIRDHGKPFDPRDPPDPDLDADVENRSVGGLGIFLVREFADEITYSHDPASGWNELIVTKGQ